jgi:hypothetical protein
MLADQADARRAWERQAGETGKQHHGFCHYRGLPVHSRSLDAAWQQHRTVCLGQQPNHKRTPKRWAIWAAAWGWVERAGLHDDELDRQQLAKDDAENLAMRERHLRATAFAFQNAMVPFRVVHEAVSDADVLRRLIAEAKTDTRLLAGWVDKSARSQVILPALIETERMLRGVKDAPDVTNVNEGDVHWADARLALPDAVEHLQAALDVVARPVDEPKQLAAPEPERPAEPAPQPVAAPRLLRRVR